MVGLLGAVGGKTADRLVEAGREAAPGAGSREAGTGLGGGDARFLPILKAAKSRLVLVYYLNCQGKSSLDCSLMPNRLG